jgi:nucleoside-diphosphate-sugar epimerase
MNANVITVLGAKGFVGKALSKYLRALGHHVYEPEREAPEIMQRPLGIVYYCIGLTSDYSKRPFDTVQAHVSYLACILEKAKFEHIIYLSSTRLYDSLSTAEAYGNSPLSLSPNNPRHLYDLSKALGENLCLTVAAERSSIVRLSSVYDTKLSSPSFLSELVQRMQNERTLIIDSSPGYCRDYITLDDVTLSLFTIGAQRARGIYNIASGVNTYNQEIADSLRSFGVDIKFTRPGEQMQLPRCNIDHLIEWGVKPANTLLTLQNFVRNLAA